MSLLDTYGCALFLEHSRSQSADVQSSRRSTHGEGRSGEHEHGNCRAPAGSPVITEDGPVRGTNVFGVLGYLGIPYAAPPVGKLRWMPPQPHGMFSGVFDANAFGNFCTQPNGAGGTLGAEDCLTLNVITPAQIRA